MASVHIFDRTHLINDVIRFLKLLRGASDLNIGSHSTQTMYVLSALEVGKKPPYMAIFEQMASSLGRL